MNQNDSSPFITGLNHVNVVTPAELEEPVIEFYRDILALPVIPKPGDAAKRGGAWFRIGNLQLHVSREAGSATVSTHSQRHYCLETHSLSALRDHLERQGIALLPDARPIEGIERIFLRDPAGNLIEIQQVKS